ncbi:MAG: polysaccharide deacetylase family protein [Mucinivorans sp.]
MIIITIVIVVCAVMFYGSYSVAHSFYLKSLCRGGDSSMGVAITFDDGVDPVMTPKVLRVLHRYGAKATFFIIGDKARQYPELVKQIVDGGHTVGNHSYYHQPYFPMKSSSAMCREIEMCSETLKSITGQDVVFFRPPFGVTNPMVRRAADQSGLTSIGWSIRSLDTMGGAQDQIYSRVTRKLKTGSVVLLHDNLDGAEALLDAILSQMQSKGLRSITINELFDAK